MVQLARLVFYLIHAFTAMFTKLAGLFIDEKRGHRSADGGKTQTVK
jgi:hypothetical protein